MIDNHVHIGQFEDVYYDPLEVADIVLAAAPGIIDGLAFSSTTSCVGGVSYRRIEKEICGLLASLHGATENARPYFWFIPDYIEQGVGIGNAGGVIPYQGIKLHPYAQHWDFENPAHADALHGLFDYAALHELPVLIHTGHSGVDSADRFERFFAEYRNVRFVLAHCRPLDTAVAILNKYCNVYCDTAFVPDANMQTLINAGLKDRIIFGTDFPITHYYAARYPAKRSKPGCSPGIALREQYAEDVKGVCESAGRGGWHSEGWRVGCAGAESVSKSFYKE
jgi:hypothetical protein